MEKATELPNLGSLRINDEDAVDVEWPRWVRRAQDEWSQELGEFPRQNLVLAFLVEGERHGTEWFLPRESSIRLSIASECFHVGEGIPLRRVYCFLAIPEYVYGTWVLGRVFHSLDHEMEGRLIRAVDDAACESERFSIKFDPREVDLETGTMCGTMRFAACLDGSNTMFMVKRLPDEAVMVGKTRVGYGNSVDFETLVFRSSGEIARRISSRRRCPFCAARGVPCECARSFRERALMDRTPSKSWEDFIARNRRDLSDNRTLFDFRLHMGGRERILPFRQTSSFHLQDDDVLREMRYSLLCLATKATIGLDLRLGIVDPSFGSLLESEWSVPTNGLSDGQSISSESKLLCLDCGRAFTCVSNLGRHRRASHGQGILFECDLCHRTFAQRTNLARHRVAVHEGRRDYDCEVCHSRFSTRANLSRHALAKHKSTVIQ